MKEGETLDITIRFSFRSFSQFRTFVEVMQKHQEVYNYIKPALDDVLQEHKHSYDLYKLLKDKL
jgi:hypothetical protein